MTSLIGVTVVWVIAPTILFPPASAVRRWLESGRRPCISCSSRSSSATRSSPPLPRTSSRARRTRHLSRSSCPRKANASRHDAASPSQSRPHRFEFQPPYSKRMKFILPFAATYSTEPHPLPPGKDIVGNPCLCACTGQRMR